MLFAFFSSNSCCSSGASSSTECLLAFSPEQRQHFFKAPKNYIAASRVQLLWPRHAAAQAFSGEIQYCLRLMRNDVRAGAHEQFRSASKIDAEAANYFERNRSRALTNIVMTPQRRKKYSQRT